MGYPEVYHFKPSARSDVFWRAEASGGSLVMRGLSSNWKLERTVHLLDDSAKRLIDEELDDSVEERNSSLGGFFFAYKRSIDDCDHKELREALQR